METSLGIFFVLIALFSYFYGYSMGKTMGKNEAELEQSKKELNKAIKEFGERFRSTKEIK